jgi:hypothetical protein
VDPTKVPAVVEHKELKFKTVAPEQLSLDGAEVVAPQFVISV